MDNPILAAAGMLATVLLVLAGAYFFTRYAGMSLGGGFAALRGGGRIQVLARAGLGKDQALLVVRAGERYLLLGSTAAGLTLLAELTKEEGEAWNPPVPPEGPEQKKPPDFRALMRRLREKT